MKTGTQHSAETKKKMRESRIGAEYYKANKDKYPKMKKKDLNDIGCYHLAQAVIFNCLQSARGDAKKVGEIRINFAKNNKMIQLWCDVAEIDEKRVRQAIIDFNSNYLKNKFY